MLGFTTHKPPQAPSHDFLTQGTTVKNTKQRALLVRRAIQLLPATYQYHKFPNTISGKPIYLTLGRGTRHNCCNSLTTHWTDKKQQRRCHTTLSFTQLGLTSSSRDHLLGPNLQLKESAAVTKSNGKSEGRARPRHKQTMF
jgi:hypothetical protein